MLRCRCRHAEAAVPTGDDVVHAHFIPGVKLHPPVAVPQAESSATHAESSAPRTDAAAPAGDDVVHAHLIPGVKLHPPVANDAETAHPTLGSPSNPEEAGVDYPGAGPGADPNCGPGCAEVIDE